MRLTPFARGVLAGLLIAAGARAIHWFITPAAHPDAGSLQQALVAIQAVVGFGGAVMLTLAQRSERTV